MVDVKSENFEMGKIITITQDDINLDIMMGGNGDLYFSPRICGKMFIDSNEDIAFTIGEEDGDIYPLFLRLYEKILEYSPYDEEDDEFSFDIEPISNLEREKDKYRKYPLVKDGVISWHSDDDYEDCSSILKIRKVENNIVLTFSKSHPEDKMYQTYSIRFRNSGSSYSPFNCRFMELYNSLSKIDFNYHQISILEYLKKQKVKR